MKAILVMAVISAVVGATTSAATAADECRGLRVCLPVEGPWVAIAAPRPSSEAPATEYVLACPLPNYVVAGVDVRISDPAVDVAFRAETGSPVAPGTTTGRAVVFNGTYGGSARKPTSFKPFIGCIPASGGGGQSQTSFRPGHDERVPAALKPTRPLTRVVVNARIGTGKPRIVVARCPAGARLVHAAHAVAFRSALEPGPAVLSSVVAGQSVAADRVMTTAQVVRTLPPGTRAEIQVQAVCLRGAG